MSLDLELKVNRPSKVFREGEEVQGVVKIRTNQPSKHEGIILSLIGSATTGKTPAVLESFSYGTNRTPIMEFTNQIAKAAKVSEPVEIPFKVLLQPDSSSVPMFETYHGLHVNVNYTLRCELKRGLMHQNLVETQEITVIKFSEVNKNLNKSESFIINNDTIVKSQYPKSDIPKFSMSGVFTSTTCNLNQPFSGKLTVEKSEKPIKSIDIQLMRVEKCPELNNPEKTEVQSLQIAEGDIRKEFAIPLHMSFPRMFVCSSVAAHGTCEFDIGFEMNLNIIFHDNNLVSESFPITTIRVS